LCTGDSSLFSEAIAEEIEEGVGLADGTSEMLLVAGVVLGRVVVEGEVRNVKEG